MELLAAIIFFSVILLAIGIILGKSSEKKRQQEVRDAIPDTISQIDAIKDGFLLWSVNGERKGKILSERINRIYSEFIQETGMQPEEKRLFSYIKNLWYKKQ